MSAGMRQFGNCPHTETHAHAPLHTHTRTYTHARRHHKLTNMPIVQRSDTNKNTLTPEMSAQVPAGVGRRHNAFWRALALSTLQTRYGDTMFEKARAKHPMLQDDIVAS